MILEDYSGGAVLERLLRCERRIEGSLFRNVNELRRVHDQRRKADAEAASTLARWREEDDQAWKAQAFAPGVLRTALRGRTAQRRTRRGLRRPASAMFPPAWTPLVRPTLRWDTKCAKRTQLEEEFQVGSVKFQVNKAPRRALRVFQLHTLHLRLRPSRNRAKQTQLAPSRIRAKSCAARRL